MILRILFLSILFFTLIAGQAESASLTNDNSSPFSTDPSSGLPSSKPTQFDVLTPQEGEKTNKTVDDARVLNDATKPIEETIDNAKDIAAAGSLNWLGECWLCPVFKILDDTRKNFGTPACQYVSSQVVTLVPMTIGIFMMVSAVMMLLPFGPGKSASNILGTVLNRTLLLIVVVALLYDCKTFNTYISGPIYTMGIAASQTAMNVGINAHTAFGLKTDCVDPLASGGGTEASFYCMLEVASKTIGVPIRLGMNIIKDINDMNWWDKMVNSPKIVAEWAMSVAMIVIGILIVITYFMLNVDFALYTTIFEVLSSFYVLMFLHPITRGFALSSLKGLFASAVGLFLASLVLTAQIAMIAYTIDVQPDLKSVDDVAKYLIDTGEKDPARGFGDPVFLMLLAGSLVINAAMAGVSSQAKALVSAGSNIGIPQIGGDFAQKLQERIQGAFQSVGDTVSGAAYNKKLSQDNRELWAQKVLRPFGKSAFGRGLRVAMTPVSSAVRGVWNAANKPPTPRTEA